MTPKHNSPVLSPVADAKLSRREFFKTAAVVSGGTLGGAFLGSLPQVQAALSAAGEGASYPLGDAANQLYSVCQQCNTQCGIKVKLIDGVAVKIDGNPFSPGTSCHTCLTRRRFSRNGHDRCAAVPEGPSRFPVCI